MNDPILNAASKQQVEPLKGFTADLGTTVVDEMKYYYSPIQTNQFHRQDGKKIPFLFNFHETKIKEDQDYLDNEIKSGNPYVSYATPDQIREAHMRMNPKQTIKDELLQDPDVQAKIDAEVERKLQALINGGVMDRHNLAGVDAAGENKDKTIIDNGTVMTVLSPGSQTVNGLDKLKGIVGSDKLAGAQSGSTSGTLGAGTATSKA